MDEAKSQSSCKDDVYSENSNETDSSVKSDILHAEVLPVSNLLGQQDVELNKETIQIQETVNHSAEAEMDTVLLSHNEKKECHSFISENSINMPIESTTSLNDSLDDEFLEQTSSCNVNISQEKPLHKSSLCNDIRLDSTILSDSFSCASSNKTSEHVESRTDKEETLFSSQLCASDNKVKSPELKTSEVQNDIQTVGNTIENSNLDTKMITSNNEREVPVNITTCEEFHNNKEQKSSQPIRNSRTQGKVIVRPLSSLIDDSKLVKISLPTNPASVMQSNTQFLNKSRNFLNFITEKSTNIMEKALLPQHLTVKYNSMMKSIDNTYSDRKHVEESCSVKPLTELSVNSVPKLVEKTENVPCPLTNPTDKQHERNEYIANYEDKGVVVVKPNENTCFSIERDLKDNNNFDNIKLIDTKQITPHIINDDIDKIGDDTLCKETKGNCNEDINSTVLNSESNDSSCSNTNISDSIHQTEEQATECENSKQSLLNHPAYLTLLKDYADLKAKYLKCQEKIEYLEERNRTLETESKKGIYSVQVENLEKTINRLTSELHTSLTAQEVLRKEYSAANKERESMVMKYAIGEKQLIDTQRARESAERKAKESGKQQELLQNKLREMQAERVRICNILDGKCREVTDLQKEVERLKKDVNLRDVKLEWNQNKLKSEMDLQKETQQKLEKATTRISELKEESEQVRKEAQESMRKFQRSEENKAVTLDQQLKEQEAQLILERQMMEDNEKLRFQLQKEIEVLKHGQQILIEENNTLSLKVQDAEKNCLNYESNLNSLKITAEDRQKKIVELLSKISELETLKLQLQHKDQHLASVEEEIKLLRTANEELQADMFACRQKEAEMLDFTQKLTDKNVRLQSEFTAIETKVKQLEEEHGPLHERIKDLTGKIKILEETLIQERKTRNEECEILARHLAEQTQMAQNLAQRLEDSQGENAVLKRKQQISMKEMTRELQQCRKKLEAFETSSPYNSLGVASRAGSNMSLNTGDALNGALSDNSTNGEQNFQSLEPSKQTLIDRIIKLQEDNAKKAEKLDFFEEHSRTLVEELQKKTKIIQTYILHENAGAMGSNERDRYKAELARHGGIMASVYNQRVSDDNMTLELSLEINQKLQAVLEDALFKNITLKDNIDTLGEEIARLTMQNRQKEIAN
ncbi:coiled-coil domain-containing protein 186 isoform X2 [Calliopsis andreniformis]|uniref:coiled-coil domain-containing protein 186 isoform X2 n=1 Tax=Calliopsis andreniformis TaxID=337506 RepID=UPI003FCD2358